MPKKRHFPDGDDGHTVAPMNVDGMPWYVAKSGPSAPGNQSEEPLDRKSRRAMLGGVLGAALLVTAVFGLAYLLFILFCTNIWFK